MNETRDQRGRFVQGVKRTKTPHIRKHGEFSRVLLNAIDRIVIARGTSRPIEIVRYATRALNAPCQPPKEPSRPCYRNWTGGYLEDSSQINITIPREFWTRVQNRAVILGEHVFATLGLLVQNGLVVRRPIDKGLVEDPVDRAVQIVSSREGQIDLATIDQLVWPNRGEVWPDYARPQGGSNFPAATLLVQILEERRVLLDPTMVTMTDRRRRDGGHRRVTRTVWTVNRSPGNAVL